MDGSSKTKKKACLDMLNRGTNIYIYITVIILSLSCRNEKTDTKSTFLLMKNSKAAIGNEYQLVFNSALDSLTNWKTRDLNKYSFLQYPYKLDSLLCFNIEKNKTIGALLISDSINNNNTGDAIKYFYGIKIKEKWWFFSGETIVLPREAYQKDIHNPLSFSKLHEIAMDEIFNAYLTKDGEINDNFFSTFKRGPYNTGLKDKETLDFEYLSYCKGIWMEKYAPYKQEDFSLVYNEQKKEAQVSFILQTPDSIYLEPIGYKIFYQTRSIEEERDTHYNWGKVNWKQNKLATGTLKNILPNDTITIYIEENFYYHHPTNRLGPFIFKIKDLPKNHIVINNMKNK